MVSKQVSSDCACVNSFESAYTVGSCIYYYLRLGLKSTYSRACVELLAVEMKLKRRKTRSGTPSSWVNCLWMICSLNDICCGVFLRNRYQPMTFWQKEGGGCPCSYLIARWLATWTMVIIVHCKIKDKTTSTCADKKNTYFLSVFKYSLETFFVNFARIVIKAVKSNKYVSRG